MNIKKFLFFSLVFIAVVIIQTLLPNIIIVHHPVTLDMFLLYITVIALMYNQLSAILIGFFIGLIQDFSTQSYMMGAFAFMKSLTGYLLGGINNFKQIWDRKIRFLFVFGCYIIHFTVYHYIYLTRNQESLIIGIKLVLIHSLINMLVLWFIDKFIYRSKLV
jgi:rod shape-determining protein MreD